jgi:hypothetical protein
MKIEKKSKHPSYTTPGPTYYNMIQKSGKFSEFFFQNILAIEKPQNKYFPTFFFLEKFHLVMKFYHEENIVVDIPGVAFHKLSPLEFKKYIKS